MFATYIDTIYGLIHEILKKDSVFLETVWLPYYRY